MFLFLIWKLFSMDTKMSSARLRLVGQSTSFPRMLKKCQNACLTQHAEALSLIHLAFHYITIWALTEMVLLCIGPFVEQIQLKVVCIWLSDMCLDHCRHL